ncbi:MAG: tetratricopeptide repeat protein, partial [Pseudomonadota bacterium]
MSARLIMLMAVLAAAVPARAELRVTWTGPVAERAGLEPGDVLVAWQAGNTEGVLDATDDLWRMLNSTGRRTVVTLTGTRESASMRWRLPADTLDLQAFSEPAAPPFARIGSLMRLPDDEWARTTALERYLDAAPTAQPVELIADLMLAQWLDAHPGWLAEGDAAARVLARWRDTLPDAGLPAMAWRLAYGERWVAQGEFDAAAEIFAPVATGPDAAPSSDLAVMMALIDNARGDMAAQSGDLDGAQVHYQRALDRLASLAPSSGASADARRDLGTVHAMRGDMASAEYHYVEALVVDTRIERDTGRARTLNNLGIVAARRGDIAGAERYYQDALVLNEAFGRWRSYSTNLFNLGDLADARGDHSSALALFERARDRFAADEPGGLRELQARLSIANMLLELDRLDEANAQYAALLTAYEAVAPGNEQVSGVYLGLGDIARLRGDLVSAQTQLETALTLRAAAAPGSVG